MSDYITPIVGYSELLRDWLIENGAKWNRHWGWYFEEGTAIPTLPAGLEIKQPIYLSNHEKDERFVYLPEPVGTRLVCDVYCDKIYKINDNRYCYHFQYLDWEHHSTIYIIWLTTPKDIEENRAYYLTGTIKRKQKYRDEYQTVFTNCRIKPIEEVKIELINI